MIHSFDTDHAQLYGQTEAVLIQHLVHWINANRAEGRNLHDGRTWTYNSVRAYLGIFPYMTEWQVRSALEHLVEAGVLITGNFATRGRDRTRWFAFEDESRFVPLPRADAAEKAAERATADAAAALAAANDQTPSSAKPSAHLVKTSNGKSNGAESETLAGGPSAHLRNSTNGASAHLMKTSNAFGENLKSTLCTGVNAVKNSKTAGARAGELASDWTLPDEWAAWTRETFPTWPDEHIEVVAASFHAHWSHERPKSQDGHQEEKRSSWRARWRAWCHGAPQPFVEPEPPDLTDLPKRVEVLERWQTTEQGTVAQGKLCGLTAAQGESMEAFRERIHDALAGRKPKAVKAQAPKPFPCDLPERAPTPTPEVIAAHRSQLAAILPDLATRWER